MSSMLLDKMLKKVNQFYTHDQRIRLRGAIGQRVRLLTERLVVRAHPGASCFSFFSGQQLLCCSALQQICINQVPLVQWLSRVTHTDKVAGSNPAGNIIFNFEKINKTVELTLGWGSSFKFRAGSGLWSNSLITAGSLVQGYDSRLGCERSRVQIPDEPTFCSRFCVVILTIKKMYCEKLLKDTQGPIL